MTTSIGAGTYTPPTISFEELSSPQGSPTESGDLESFKATRVLRCAWSDRLTLFDQLLTAYNVVSGTRTFVIGDKYPHRSRVYARRISSITGVGPIATDSTGVKRWEYADLRVEYESRSFDPEGGGGISDSSDSPAEAFQVAEETIQPSAEFLTFPTGSIYLDSSQKDPVAEANAPGVFIPMFDYTYSYTENLGSSGTLSSDLVNKLFTCNSASISSTTLGLTFDAETLIFLGPSVRLQTLSNGDRIADVSLQFRFRRTGCNKFFVKDSATPVDIYDSSGSIIKPYEPVNFVSLFA